MISPSVFSTNSMNTDAAYHSTQKTNATHLAMSFSTLVQAMSQGPVALREELKTVPHFSLHPVGFGEAGL